MQNDILFDNIYIGHSIQDAETLRKETFDIKKPIEAAEEEAQKPKPEEEKPPVSFSEDPISYVREKVETFIDLARENPVQAVQELPEVAGGLGALLATILLVIFGTLRLGGSAATPKDAVKKGKEVASAAKEKNEEAISSATETKGGATKRTTRSSAE